MRFEIFASRNRADLKERVNKWLETHPVSPDSMKFEYHAVYLEDPEAHIIEHTLVLFYVPMMEISRQ